MNPCRRFVHLVLFGAMPLLIAVSVRSAFGDGPSPAAIGAWVQSQVDDGRLTVNFYDRSKPPKQFPGWTDFEFRLEYTYDYQVELVSKTRRKGSPQVAILVPTFKQIEVPIKHRIELPDHLKSDRWYEFPLPQHELDHVRVGLHPRLVLLGRQLVKSLNRIEVEGATPADLKYEWVEKQINDRMTLRRDAIQNLVASINRKLDADTNHGAVPLPNADEFMSRLYLKENLDEMKFPYLAEVLDLVRSAEYQQAQLVIREVPPRNPPLPK